MAPASMTAEPRRWLARPATMNNGRLRKTITATASAEVFGGTPLDISKSALSKHVSMLAEAGYVAQRRAVRDTRQRVWLSLTEAGRSAYRGHVAALHRIVGHTYP